MSSCPTPMTITPSLGFSTAAVVMVSTGVQQLVGSDPQRRSVTVIVDADGTSPCYLLANPSQPATSGLKLKPGAGFTLNTTAPVYVVCPAGDGTTVYAVAESGSA